MNLISLVLAIAAIVIFALSYRGHPHGNIGLGLALTASAWVIQLIWTTDQITL